MFTILDYFDFGKGISSIDDQPLYASGGGGWSVGTIILDGKISSVTNRILDGVNPGNLVLGTNITSIDNIWHDEGDEDIEIVPYVVSYTGTQAQWNSIYIYDPYSFYADGYCTVICNYQRPTP